MSETIDEQIEKMSVHLFRLNGLEGWTLKIGGDNGDGLTQHESKRIIVGRKGGIGLLCHEIAHAILPRSEMHSGLHADKMHMVFNQAIAQAEKEARLIELDLLEQALNDGRDLQKYKTYRLNQLRKDKDE